MNKIAPIGNTLPVAGSANADRKFKVGIVGAGSAGLFTAMIFDHLKENFGLDVEYEILERNGRDRVGGRLYTYNFPRGEEHHYFDVGAMRFPNIAIMSRTFALFRELDMDFCDQREKPDPWKKQTRPYKVRKPVKGDLIPYYLNGPNQVTLFNGVPVSNAKGLSADMFGITGLSPEYILLPFCSSQANSHSISSQIADDIMNHAIHEFTDVYYKRGPEAFWKLLTQEGDAYSVRHFLARAIPLVDHPTIEFLETLKYGKGWYDQSFTELVLQSLDHESQEAEVKWWCVEGGAQEIAKNMAASLKQTSALKFDKRVTAMSYIDHDNDGEKTGPFDKVEVKVDGERTPRIYDAVFNSVPLGAMEHMQLEGLNLNWGTKQAIRNLAYGSACKVGIRFRTMWWVKDGLNVFSGGISKTDLPLRWCVYPSYNIHDDPNRPAVLLASYTWGQEADRLGALINGASPHNEEELKQLLLHNLARLHTTDDASFEKLLKKLNDEYIDHYAYDWSAHPGSIGAIAYFGPGQFNNMYQWITRSNGKMMIIGEAASSHHAWVVGQLPCKTQDTVLSN
ncbi:hypothetical protein DM02DRAFT_541807 [Periconia macrospinosa]|uniref:Amine oxidase domain-containing protein n=1 Tax=Periconia macrospinosa TaxID=97972 RepID=A0A2V1D5I4_9PLEO|nr:hypothetical protein DM02DRAFT_541807 [Periconia macrospinosa]